MRIQLRPTKEVTGRTDARSVRETVDFAPGFFFVPNPRTSIHPNALAAMRHEARIMESPALPLHRPCYRPVSPVNS